MVERYKLRAKDFIPLVGVCNYIDKYSYFSRAEGANALLRIGGLIAYNAMALLTAASGITASLMSLEKLVK